MAVPVLLTSVIVSNRLPELEFAIVPDLTITSAEALPSPVMVDPPIILPDR